MPDRFAATTSTIEPEAVWWDGYGDPVLSGSFAAQRMKTAT